MSNEPEKGFEQRVESAVGGEWLLVEVYHYHPDAELVRIVATLSERRAPGHVPPLKVQVEATGRYPAALEEQVIRTIRRLSRLEG